MTKKLLLADDSITIQKVIGIIFATEDYQLLVTDNGDEAYAKALEEFPDLIIADVSMPGKDGFELCQAVKSDLRLAKTSVLLLPGTFEHFDEQRAQEVGADGWLTKPFESQALLDKVEQLSAAEPIRLTNAAAEPEPEAEDTSLVTNVDFSGDETGELGAVFEPPAEVGDAPELDEQLLGLDEVDLPAAAEDAEGESAEDIWDAVSFEEDELAVAEPDEPASGLGAAPAEEVSDFSATEDGAVGLAAVDSGSEFAELDSAEEEILELTDEVTDEPSESAEPGGLAAAGSEVVDEKKDESVELAEDTTGEVAFEAPAALIEPVDEAVLEADEEVIDLAEEDVLEAPLTDLVPPVDGDLTAEPFAAEESFVDLQESDVELPEESPDEDDEVAFEAEEETGLGEDAGFYFDAGEADADEPLEADAAVEAVAETFGPPVASEAAVAVEQQLRQLSEDELKDVVAKVAGPIIERQAKELLEQIAWEVVPDLAEAMIREEIRKIKEGGE